jgi:GT2 family glycosyltransferase
MSMSDKTTIGAVVIGRNEGERLKICLRSVIAQVDKVVYVDSGSTDGSVDFAKSLNVDVVDLDMSTPFSASRARNEGFFLLRRKYPELRMVQFIDGDCELCEGWAEKAQAFLEGNDQYGIVSGTVKERSPEKSIYNELCDIGWTKPAGDSLSCGGIFMARIDAFSAVDGFDAKIIAGEEPELCHRLREKGWKIFCLDTLMTLHDSNMTRFRQWWKRTVRTGYGYAYVFFLHMKKKDGYYRKETLRIWAWALALPVFTVLLSMVWGPWALLALSAYPVQLYRGYKRTLTLIHRKGPAFRYAFFNVLGKWPELVGQLVFLYKEFFSRNINTFQYKK